MTVKYTPGNNEGLVGKTYKVEVIGFTMFNDRFIKYPMIKEVLIKYEDGRVEKVDANKFYNSLQSNKYIKTYPV